MSYKIKKYKLIFVIFISIMSLPVIGLILKYSFYLGLMIGKYLRFL